MRLDDPRSYLVDYTDDEKLREVWKPIAGYEGRYEISNLGRVKSLARTSTYTRYQYQTHEYVQSSITVPESIIKPGIHEDFYWNVPLTKDGHTKIHLLHLLLATAFIPNPNKLPCVNHIDGDKRNIRISNMEWATFSYNNIHAVRNGSRTQNIPVKCIETGLIYSSMADADRLLQMPKGSCWRAIHEDKKVHGYSFIKVIETMEDK